MDSPPTSLVEPSIENFSKVIFSKVEKKYKTGVDIKCGFTYTESFQPREKDWVGIFKVGWKITREYFTYVFVKCSDESPERSVIFKAYYIPKASEEFYQFCYVDENGEVRGASIPFQICQEIEMEEDDDMLMVMPEDTLEKFQAQVSSLEEENASHQKTIDELQTKNEQLENEKKELLIRLESERNRNATDNQTLEKEVKKQYNDKLMQLQSDLKNTEQLLKKSQMETLHEKDENDAQEKEVAKLRVEMTLQEVAITDLKEKLQMQSETVKMLEMEKENLEHAVEEQNAKTLEIQEEMNKQLTSTKEQLCKTEKDLHQEKMQSETVKTLEMEKENLEHAVEEQNAKTLEIQAEMNKQLTSTKEQLCKTEKDLHQEKIAKTTQQNVIEMLNSTIAKQDAEITELRRQNQIAGLAHQNEAEKLHATNAEQEANITVLRGQVQAERKMLENCKKKFQNELAEEQAHWQKKDVEIRTKDEQIRTLHKDVAQWKDNFKKLEELVKMHQEELQDQKTRSRNREEEILRQYKQKLANQERDFNEQKFRLSEELKKLQTVKALQESEVEDLREERKNNNAEIVSLNEKLSTYEASVPSSQSGSLSYGNPYEERRSEVFNREQTQSNPTRSVRDDILGTIDCPICKMQFPEYEQEELQDHLMCHELEEEEHALNSPSV